MAPKQSRPYRRPGIILLSIGGLLIVASLPQLFLGIPTSEGFAPAGLSLGPLLLLVGACVYFAKRPTPGEKWEDNGDAQRFLL